MNNPLSADLDRILKSTLELWEDMRGGKIFITGGTGFFGCWLLESFLAANEKMDLNAEAVVLTRNADAFRKKAPYLAAGVDLVEGDVVSFAFPNGGFSHVIHAATEASAKLIKEDPLGMFDTIVEGTRRVLDFAVGCGAKKLLLTSSGAVYGRQPSDLPHIPEDYPGAPDTMIPASVYGEGKRASELLCSVYSQKYGLETKIARCFAFVGPHLPLDTHFAIGNFIRDGLCGGPVKVGGDGTPYRSYLYAADLTAWLWTILFRGKSCRPYNVGSSEDISIADTAVAVAEVLGMKNGVVVAGKPEPGKKAERYVPSVERAREELGLVPTVGLREAISRTVDWHKTRGISHGGILQ